MNEDWKERYFRQYAERFKESQETLFEDIKAFIATERELVRKETLEEVEKAIEDYFKGLVMVPFPEKTKESILVAIKSLGEKK